MSKFVLLSGVAMMLPLAPPAMAQTVDEAPAHSQSVRPGEIIVTAQRRAERLIEVPVSVDVITEAQLEQTRTQEVSDIAAITPGVSFSSSTVRGGGFRIRGVGSTAGSGEPSVSYVVDGVVYADQASALDLNLFDTKTIEVLRGPQGTLFGKNASSGVINITTKAPSRDFQTWVEGTVAEFGEREIRASVSGPIGEELGFRIGGTHREIEGHLFNRFSNEHSGGLNQESVRGKLTWERGIGRVTLIADYTDRRDYGLSFTERASTDPNRLALLNGYGITPSADNRFQAYDVPTFSSRKSGGVSLQTDLDIGRHVITAITAWRLSNNGADDLDADGLPISIQPATPTLANSYNELLVEEQHADSGRSEQLSQEIRLTSPSGGPIEYVAGLYGMWLKERAGTFRTASQCVAYSPTTLTSGPASPLIQVPSPIASCDHPDPTRVEIIARGTSNDGNVSDTESLAAFGNMTAHVTDQLSLIAGLRYTAEDRSNRAVQGSVYDQSLTFLTTATGPVRSAFNIGLGRPPATPIPAGTVLLVPDNPGTIKFASQSNDNGSGRAGVRFQPNRNLNIYATFAKGYKGPALNIGTGIYTKAEKSNAYEAGVKANLADGRVTTNFAAFLTDFTGFQANSFDSTLSRYTVVNAGDVRTYGFEADIQAEPIEGLDLMAGVTYAKARIRDFDTTSQCYAGQPVANNTAAPVPAPPQDGNCYIIGGTATNPIYGQNVDGGRLPGSPDWKFNLSGRYVQPIGDAWYAMMGANYTWQSDALFDLAQDPGTQQDSYGLLDLTLGFGPQSRKWSITAFAKNVLDKHYASTILYTPVSQVNVDNNIPTSDTTPATANPSAGNYVNILPRNAFRQLGVTLRVKFGGED